MDIIRLFNIFFKNTAIFLTSLKVKEHSQGIGTELNIMDATEQ